MLRGKRWCVGWIARWLDRALVGSRVGWKRPREAPASRGRSLTIPPSNQPTHSERQIVVIQRRPVPCRRSLTRCVVGGWRGGRGATPRYWRRVWAGRPVPRRPDDAFTAGPASLSRLVPALEVGRAGIALRCAVVPHRAAADRTQWHPVGIDAWSGDGTLAARWARRRLGRGRPRGRTLGWARRSWRDCRCPGCDGPARASDHAVASAVLALEVGRLRIALALAVVPHLAPTLRAVGNRAGGVGRVGFGHAA